MIRVIKCDGADLVLPKRETVRYLGYGSKTPDDPELLKRIDECTETVRKALDCKACFDRFPLTQLKDGVRLGSVDLFSKDLKRHLSGCREAYLFTATLGLAVDRILQRFSLLSPADAVIAEAVGTTAIENFCDEIERQLHQSEPAPFRTRFSAGYGDFPLETQPILLNLLDTSRKIGVTLTEGLMMTPTKSVSAIIGIGGTDSAL